MHPHSRLSCRSLHITWPRAPGSEPSLPQHRKSIVGDQGAHRTLPGALGRRPQGKRLVAQDKVVVLTMPMEEMKFAGLIENQS